MQEQGPYYHTHEDDVLGKALLLQSEWGTCAMD